MRIREQRADRFQGMENEITAPIHLPRRAQEAAEPAAPSPEDVYEGPRSDQDRAVPRAPSELAELGSGLDPNQIPPQIIWDEEMVNHASTEGQRLGGVTQEQVDAHGRLAREVVGAEPNAELNAGDLAALIEETGVDPAKVDPNQLVSATRYVNDAANAEERAERLRKTLTSFTVLSTIGAPPIDDTLMKEKLFQEARVPNHAFEKMSSAEISRVYQEVAADLNGAPGKFEVKVGDHTLKLNIGEHGDVLSSECKKPGFISRLASVGRAALSIAALIPSPIQPFAAIGSGVVNAVRAARDGSILGMVGAAASALGAGFARFGGSMLDRAAQVARGVSSAARGIQNVQRGGIGNVVSGLAGMVGGVAGVAGHGLQSMADRVQTWADRVAPVGAAQTYHRASQAVGEAERALSEARAGGDAQTISAAEESLERARRSQRGALYSGLGSVAGAAGTFSSSGSNFNRAMNTAGRTFDAARGVNDRDWISAANSALGAADAARGPRETFDWLHSASNVAGAGNRYRLALNAERDAGRAVDAAESALSAARRSGNAAAIGAAEEALRDARRGRGDAIAGSYHAQNELGGVLGSTVDQYRIAQRERETRAAVEAAEEQRLAELDAEQLRREEGAISLKNDADEAAAELADVLANERATGGFASLAEEAIADIERLKGELDDAVASGDLEIIHRAADALENARVAAHERAAMLNNVLAPPVDAPAPALPEEFELPLVADYQIRAGDRLENLAAENGLSLRELLDANPGIDARRLMIGQTINLPTATRDPAGRDILLAARENAVRDREATLADGDRVLTYIDHEGKTRTLVIPGEFIADNERRRLEAEQQLQLGQRLQPKEKFFDGIHQYWDNVAQNAFDNATEDNWIRQGLKATGARIMGGLVDFSGLPAVENDFYDLAAEADPFGPSRGRINPLTATRFVFDSGMAVLGFIPGVGAATRMGRAAFGVNRAAHLGMAGEAALIGAERGLWRNLLTGAAHLDDVRPAFLSADGTLEFTRRGNYMVTRTLEGGPHLPAVSLNPLGVLDESLAFAPGRPEIRLGQLFDESGAVIRNHADVAIFRGHGYAPTATGFGGFNGLSNREAAAFAADEIHRVRAAGTEVNYLALESCFQGDYGYMAFGRTNGQTFQRELDVALRRLGYDTERQGVRVLASDRPGALYGVDVRLPSGVDLPARFIPVNQQNPGRYLSAADRARLWGAYGGRVWPLPVVGVGIYKAYENWPRSEYPQRPSARP